MMLNQLNKFVINQVGKGACFGTFGELLQGVDAKSGFDFLVTLPIDKYSWAEFIPDLSNQLEVIPEYKQKSILLATRLLKYFNLPLSGKLIIQSNLPMGKGLASSSADLVATARAIQSAYDFELPIKLLQKFLKEIEPTDGVMYSGIVSFYHREVQIKEMFGSIPPLTIVAIDEGGEVNTINYNNEKKPINFKDKLEYTQLNNKLKIAIQEQDVRAIGKVATRSAIMNQKRLEKRSLNHFLQISEQFNTLGITVAHSGTFIGLMLWQQDKDYNNKLRQVTEKLEKKYGEVHVFSTLSNTKSYTEEIIKSLPGG
ncbi:kinase [Sutcliffiella horikoshii]|uniref:Kinase n=1 Tax=Sutcliffiella horikoshii TaxID=79883 RepID=A0A5D4T629_9BACI|nr:kinase [Sutcliffiella horikoshii]TYS71053.1 kinase [Sutcliffiella horikoshii]